MLAEFLKSLVDLVRETEKPTVMKIDGRPNEVFVKWPGADANEIETLPIEPPPRQIKLASPDELVSFLLHERARASESASLESPLVFLSESRVTAYLDPKDRRETVVAPLSLTQRVGHLASLRGGRSFTVRDLVRFLRFQVEGGDQYLPKFSKLDFSRKSTGRQESTVARESFGKSVEMEVQGVQEMPEFLLLSAPVFNESGASFARMEVRAGVVIDHENQAVVLQLYSDSFEDGMRMALKEVAGSMNAQLADAGTVYLARADVDPMHASAEIRATAAR